MIPRPVFLRFFLPLSGDHKIIDTSTKKRNFDIFLRGHRHSLSAVMSVYFIWPSVLRVYSFEKCHIFKVVWISFTVGVGSGIASLPSWSLSE